jgi:patatin-like phospholipase/acyl hydrolase
MMPTRILSLSGGGIRGIFQAVYLREIETQLGKPVREYFDLVAGTSTGAIIGLGVALGLDLNKIVQLFETHGSSIFPPTVRRSANRTISWLRRGPRYDPEPLRRRLVEVFHADGTRQLQIKDCRPPVVIAAATLDRYQIRTFTTLDHCGAPDNRDGELFAADVALASAAAPLFFPAFRPRGRMQNGQIRTEERTYVDGGMWANNPTLWAIMQAHRHLGVAFADMRVISVGNEEVPAGTVGVDFNKMRRAKMLSPILDIMFSTQSELSDLSTAYLLDDGNMTGERMLRINTQLDTIVDLDNVTDAIRRLKPLAEQAARSSFAKFSKLIQG